MVYNVLCANSLQFIKKIVSFSLVDHLWWVHTPYRFIHLLFFLLSMIFITIFLIVILVIFNEVRYSLEGFIYSSANTTFEFGSEWRLKWVLLSHGIIETERALATIIQNVFLSSSNYFLHVLMLSLNFHLAMGGSPWINRVLLPNLQKCCSLRVLIWLWSFIRIFISGESILLSILYLGW